MGKGLNHIFDDTKQARWFPRRAFFAFDASNRPLGPGSDPRLIGVMKSPSIRGLTMPAQGATPPRVSRLAKKTKAPKPDADNAAGKKNVRSGSKAGPAKKTAKAPAGAKEGLTADAAQTASKPRKRKPVKPKKSLTETSAPAKSRRSRRTRSELLPHEVLLAVARGEVIADHVPTFEERVEAAKAAAPYFAPKGTATSKPVKALAHEEALAALDQAEPAGPQLVSTQDEEGNDRQKT